MLKAVIAYPTEGVWGLDVIKDNLALQKLLDLKKILGRGSILIECVSVFFRILTCEEYKDKLLTKWPGPTLG